MRYLFSLHTAALIALSVAAGNEVDYDDVIRLMRVVKMRLTCVATDADCEQSRHHECRRDGCTGAAPAASRLRRPPPPLDDDDVSSVNRTQTEQRTCR